MEIFHLIISWIITTIDAVAVLVIVYGFAKGVIGSLRLFGRSGQVIMQRVRCDVGNYLLLGMEYMIAADILHSIITPDLQGLIHLGGIVVIRTFVAYFLQRELDQIEENLEKTKQ